MNFFYRTLLILLVGGSLASFEVYASPVGAQVFVKVEVPDRCRTTPFDRERTLKVPTNAKISVLARVEKARFLAVSPQGDVLVSQPSRGKILILRQSSASEGEVHELISGRRLPHGMVFQRIGETLYLYVSESNRVSRLVYSNDSLSLYPRRKLSFRAFLTGAAPISVARTGMN
jgi:hypothetical protein